MLQEIKIKDKDGSTNLQKPLKIDSSHFNNKIYKIINFDGRDSNRIMEKKNAYKEERCTIKRR